MVDVGLLERAAQCYEAARLPREAARCYRDSGAYRRAAELHARLGLLREAAADYARAGLTDLAAWTFAHRCDDPSAARQILADAEAGRGGFVPVTALARLTRQVVEARCQVAEGAPARRLLELVDLVCERFADREQSHDLVLEEWAVHLAMAMGRDDYVALLFAAAVRGRRPGARDRWQQWAERTLGTRLVLPPDSDLPEAG